MMLNDWIVIVAVLVLSGFFSGMEIAYIASSRLRIELDRKDHRLYSAVSRIFLSHPGQYLSTILIGNNIALVVYSLFMARVISSYLFDNIAVETLISSAVVILFAEFLPKAVVKREPHVYLRIFSLPIFFFYVLFYPIAKLCTFISKVLAWIFTGKFELNNDAVTHFEIADLQDLVEDGIQQGEGESDVQASDLEMFQKALDFSDLKVRDCMVPRVEVEAVDIDDGLEYLKSRFISSRYSRIPIYENSVDNIIGYASSKDLFNADIKSVKQMVKELIYVPESGQVQKLLGELIRKHRSIAVVIDEFGATAGIVTLEDIIEQIVGDIEDEHDEDDKVERRLTENSWIFSGRQEIEYLNRKYDLSIPQSDDYDTLAGWIMFNCEELPDSGTQYELSGLKVRIVRASGNRISLVEITKLSPELSE